MAGNSKPDSKDEGEVWAHFTYSKLNDLKKKANDTTLQQDIDTHSIENNIARFKDIRYGLAQSTRSEVTRLKRKMLFLEDKLQKLK